MPNSKKLLSRLENLFPAQQVRPLAKDNRATGEPLAAATSGESGLPPTLAPALPPGSPEGGPFADQQRARGLAELPAMPTGWTWETDAQGTHLACSPEVEAVLGFTSSEMLSRSLTSLTTDSEAQRQLVEALSAGRPIMDLTIPSRGRDGQAFTLILNARPNHEEDGRLAGYRGITYAMPHAEAPAPQPIETREPRESLGLGRVIAASHPPTTGEPISEEEGALRTGSVRAIAEAWQAFIQQQTEHAWGYETSEAGLSPLGEDVTPEMAEALARGQRVLRVSKNPSDESVTEDAGRALAIPIQLQGQTIGALNFYDERGHNAWSEDDLALVHTVAEQLGLALENTRLFNETRDYLTKQTLLYEVTRAAASATNVTQALQSAADALGRVLPDSSIAILLLDKDDLTLRIRASVGFPADMVERLAVRVGEGITGWSAQNNQPVRVGDVRQDPRYLVSTSAMRSEAAVPLALGQQVIGVINVESPRLNAFTERDVRLLSTLAGTLSAIIVNNNLLEQIDQERERLALLYDVLRQLTQSLDLDTVINLALQTAPRLGAQYAYILVLGETKEEDTFRSTVPGMEELPPAQALELAHAIVNDGLESWVLKNRRTALVKDTRLDRRWNTGLLLQQPTQRVRSVISVPLQTQRGSLTGALAYTHTLPNAFSEEQLPLIESLASQVTVALENAYLHGQMRRQRSNAQTLARVTQTVSRALNENELLNVLAHELHETYVPEGVCLFRWEAGANTLIPLAVRLHPETTLKDWPVVGQPIPAVERPDLLTAIQTRAGHIRHRWPDRLLTESMVHPLLYGGDVEGVVEVVNTGHTHGLGQDEFDLFRAILAAATSALQNARLYALQRETAERLAEVDRLKSQFLANMSHELRTPLNSIIGFSRVLLKGIDGPVNEVQSQDLASINNAGHHLLSLINSILDMAKIEAGKMELVFDEVDLHEVIDTTLSTTTALIKEKPIRLEKDVARNLPSVRGDSLRLRQVMLNLLSNAAKFTEHGAITVRARLAPGSTAPMGVQRFAEVSVIDTGAGIAKEDLPKLFEAFSQVDPSPTRKTGGTGLGLSICRHLVELHGGRIWVESEPGQGSSFFFTLPIHEPEAGEPPPVAADGEEHAGLPVILAVDDDPGVINLYRRYVEPHGYKLVGLTRSAEALERAQEARPGVILLDVLMPNKDGWEVLAEFKQTEATRDIPVIMCTLIGDREHALRLGAADYLIKPILESDLLRALNKLPTRAAPVTR
jgi:signal transduction histidine kinase/transcriptional regulator with GAF, ATPase, and Fis domain/ActR/RegA family two-component response regulator